MNENEVEMNNEMSQELIVGNNAGGLNGAGGFSGGNLRRIKN